MMNMRVVLAALMIAGAAADRGVCKVKNTNDSGAGSLRNCLERADTSIGGAGSTWTIVFSKGLSGQTITIPDGADYPRVSAPETLIIKAPRGGVTIDGTQPDAGGFLPFVFFTNTGVNLRIYNVNVLGGFECVRMAGSDAIDISLTLINFHCENAQASGLFVNEPVSEVSIQGCSFNNNGNDGINISGGTQNGAYDIKISRTVANNNVNWGTFLELGSTPAGGFLAVSKYEGNFNGQYGLEAIDAGAGRMVVTLVELSKFNFNNEGCEFINANILLIRLCEFNNNVEYGLGLEDAHLTSIKGCTIVENGGYGIDLEALASIEAIDATKIIGNTLGVIKCGPDPNAATSRSTTGAAHGDEPEKDGN